MSSTRITSSRPGKRSFTVPSEAAKAPPVPLVARFGTRVAARTPVPVPVWTIPGAYRMTLLNSPRPGARPEKISRTSACLPFFTRFSLAALELRRPLLHEGRHPFDDVLGGDSDALQRALAVERAQQVGLE